MDPSVLRLLATILAVMTMSTGNGCGPAAPDAPYAQFTTSVGKSVYVRLEVADTDATRAKGLSSRETMAEDAGMLFVFPADTQAAFWMKDTLIPLSIAFISADGRVLDVQDMERLSEEIHRPPMSYRYALEVNQGFYSKNGIAAGDKVEFQLGGKQ